MINFVIVDDNKTQRKIISKYVVKKMMNNKFEFNILEFDDYNNKLIDYINNNNKETIYILDLELPNGDGIEIAREIRNKYDDWLSPIIIITVHTSLYYEVYKQRLHILDFVGKCENINQRINENIDICLKLLNKQKIYRYTYKGIDYTINLNNVDYIQREGRKIRIVTSSDNYYQNISINEIKKNLPPFFISSSKGILININNVDKIDWKNQHVLFKDNKNGFLVSKSHKKEIEEYEHC